MDLAVIRILKVLIILTYCGVQQSFSTELLT